MAVLAHKRFLTAIIVGLALFCALSPAFAAFKVPQNQGYVTDLANVMSPEAEQQVATISQELDTKAQSQMAVLIIPREQLGDTPVEDASLATARAWGVGSKKAGNTGLLIFMAVSNKPGQSKLRAEIGYGLEGAITDGTSGQIQDQYMIPAFQQGNLDAGIVNGVAAYATLIAKEKQVELISLGGEAAPVNLARQQAEAPADGWLGSALVMFIIMAIIALAFVSMLGHMFRSPYGKKGHYGSRVNDDGGLLPLILLLSALGGGGHRGGGGGFDGGGFGGFGGGGFGGGGSSRNW